MRLLHTVDVEKVPSLLRVLDRLVRVSQVDVVTRPPLENHLERVEVDLLEHAVPNGAVLRALRVGVVRQIPGNGVVGRHDGRVVARYGEFVQVCADAVESLGGHLSNLTVLLVVAKDSSVPDACLRLYLAAEECEDLLALPGVNVDVGHSGKAAVDVDGAQVVCAEDQWGRVQFW